MGYRFYRNGEGYRDPTAGLALERITSEEKRLKKALKQERLKLTDTDRRKHNDIKGISESRISSGHPHQ